MRKRWSSLPSTRTWRGDIRPSSSSSIASLGASFASTSGIIERADVASSTLMPGTRYGLVALFIALGGWLSARRVAETLSHKVTAMNPGQGFSANLVTAFLVIIASRLGMPVSTTHVSVGALFGIGVLSGSANKRG